MAERKEFNIAHLFLAGVVTAAGAGLFMWIVGQFKESEAADEREDDLDVLLAAEASAVE